VATTNQMIERNGRNTFPFIFCDRYNYFWLKTLTGKIYEMLSFHGQTLAFQVRQTMVQIWLFSSEWPWSKPGLFRSQRPWSKPGFSGHNDLVPHLVFLVQPVCNTGLFWSKWHWSKPDFPGPNDPHLDFMVQMTMVPTWIFRLEQPVYNTWLFWSKWPWSTPGVFGLNNNGPRVQSNSILKKYLRMVKEKHDRYHGPRPVMDQFGLWSACS
jgi:hypothetical protein